MILRMLNESAPIAYERNSAAICMPVTADPRREVVRERTIGTIQSILSYTEATIPLMIFGSATALEGFSSWFAKDSLDRVLVGLAAEEGTTVVEMMNSALRSLSPTDVILVMPGTFVAEGWFDGLRNAACSDSIVASSTPLSYGHEVSANRTLSSHLSANQGRQAAPLGRERDQIFGFEEAAQMLGLSSLKIRPRIASIGLDCVYLRRPALELVGQLDESGSLEEALTAFAFQSIALGMVHVAADDVLVDGRLVPHEISATASPPATSERTLVRDTIRDDESASLRRATNRARVSLSGMSVTIDGRALGLSAGGTQTYIMGLILALAREPNVALRVLVAPNLSEQAAEAMGTAPHVEIVSYQEAIEKPVRTDVVHRPQQVFTPDDLALLRVVGERVIVTQQDLIAYHNYSYHSDLDAWRAYRRTTRLALGGVDQVVFFSEHGRHDALAEDLVSEARTHIVGIGADALGASSEPSMAPEGLHKDERFLLCLGADYAHKNRPFAIKLLGALRDLGWAGRLVLAGAHVPYGSSSEFERSMLSADADLASHVLDVGPVDEPTKQWLYEHACAMVYPTLYEGFGLLPAEAARVGLPCLFAAQAALSEVAGSAATLAPWDPRTSAVAVLPLLTDGPARRQHLAALRALDAPTWAGVVKQMLGVYEHAVATPLSEAAPRIWQELDRENYIVKLDHDLVLLKNLAEEYQDAYHSLSSRVGIGLSLIDEGGLLSEAQQRGLMRVAARRRIGNIVLKPFAILGRLGSRT